jgi:hypothetical protein
MIKNRLADLISVGLIAGLLSTSIMTIFEIPFWRQWGIIGILEWHENQVLASKLKKKIKRNYHDSNNNYAGIFLLHFINGVLAAIVFPFINLIFPYPPFLNRYLLTTVYGIGYGILLWVLTLLPIHRPITGISIRNHPFGKGPVLISFSGHLLYGITLGITLGLL